MTTNNAADDRPWEYDIPSERLRAFNISGAIPEDRLSRHLLTLKTLRPDSVNFRGGRLQSLSEEEKKLLLGDMRRAEGMRPLNRR